MNLILKNMVYFAITFVAAMALIFSGLLLLARKSRKMEADLGHTNGQLKPCASSGNCSFRIDAVTENPIPKIQEILKNEDMTLVKAQERYLHALDSSKIFGFVDDVEFLYSEGKLQSRSSSRVGRSDLGANEKRLNFLLKQIKL